MEKPYLMVFEHHRQISLGTKEYKTVTQWIGQWMTGPAAAQWIQIHSNEKRIDFDPKAGGQRPDPQDINTKWKQGNLKKADLYKLQVPGEYDTLTHIYSSESLSASQFCDGVLSMQDLLFDVEW